MGFFKKFWDVVNAEPDWRCVDDQTGGRLDINYWIIALGENHNWPSVGDLIIQLESDSMGANVRRDLRWRVTELRHPYKTSFTVVSEEGKSSIFHIHNLRKHCTTSRVWLLLD